MNYFIKSFDLSLNIEIDKFKELIENARKNAKMSYQKVRRTDFGYIDEALMPKGIKVEYHNDARKRIKLVVYPRLLLDSEDTTDQWEPTKKNIKKVLRELEDCIDSYFDHEFSLNDFRLISVIVSGNVRFDDRELVTAYIRVLNNIGKVKGFSPKYGKGDKRFNKDVRFNLVGNSNGIEFSAYDKKAVTNTKKSKGVMTIEVKLTSQKAIRKYTDQDDTDQRITELAEIGWKVATDTIIWIIPFGDFYKKHQAVKIVESNVKNATMRRKMLRLIDLIPKKKSLLLAQKELKERNNDAIMGEFYKQNLSPVTISKRQDIGFLENLYVYL